ncbi:MAG: cation transporter [Clostridia bacterium]|nr:cation transporter [Clostridia bacterium]
MKTERNILIAFVLNFCFAVFEFFGGIFTGSVAILSDAVHDLGDAASIGVSCFLEKISKKQPDEKYTYGYARYSLLGGVISTLLLLFGSILVIGNAVVRLVHPIPVHQNGMLGFAVAGVIVNALAAFFTREGGSLNQKAVNLHMLEDVLGWVVVLIGSVIIKFTDFVWIDPLMSIGVAVFILINAAKTCKEILDIFLEKIPCGINVEEIKACVESIDGITDVHHIHVWTMDGQSNSATMHIVTNADAFAIKQKVREMLQKFKIIHVTLELEKEGTDCLEKACHIRLGKCVGYCHHH